MDHRPPRVCRWLIGAAGRLVPRELRPEWRRRWDRDVWNWWAFLAEHGAFDRYARAELVRHCWGAFASAAATRVELGPRAAHFVRGPRFCLLMAAVPLLAVAIFSHGFSGLRAVTGRLAYKDAGRVVVMGFYSPLRIENLTPASLGAWRKAVRLERLAAFQFGTGRLEGREVAAAHVEASFFQLLGVDAALGRVFASEDEAAAEPVAVLSYDAWKRLGSAPAPGRGTVKLDGRPVRLAGVLPPQFWFFHREIAVWTVLRLPAAWSASNPPRFGAVARLKPFANEHDTEYELWEISRQLPGRPGMWVVLLPLQERLLLARKWYVGMTLLALAAACLLAIAGFRAHPRCALLLVAKTALLAAGLALACIEIPAAVYGAGTAGRGFMLEVLFLPGVCGVVWWSWRDQRRRCRTCMDRLTLPVHFGNFGAPLLERVGTELVCERGHGSLYVPGMHWSAGGGEHWTPLDSSWTDLFTAK